MTLFDLAFIGFAGAIYYGYFRWLKQRDQTLEQFLPSQGFVKHQEAPPDLLELLPHASLTNIYEGQHQNITFVMCDYLNKINSSQIQTVVAIPLPSPHQLPRFIIRPRNNLDRLKKTIGYQMENAPHKPRLIIQTFIDKDQLPAGFWQNSPISFWEFIHERATYIFCDGYWFVIYNQGELLSFDNGSYQARLSQAISIYKLFEKYYWSTPAHLPPQ